MSTSDPPSWTLFGGPQKGSSYSRGFTPAFTSFSHKISGHVPRTENSWSNQSSLDLFGTSKENATPSAFPPRGLPRGLIGQIPRPDDHGPSQSSRALFDTPKNDPIIPFSSFGMDSNQSKTKTGTRRTQLPWGLSQDKHCMIPAFTSEIDSDQPKATSNLVLELPFGLSHQKNHKTPAFASFGVQSSFTSQSDIKPKPSLELPWGLPNNSTLGNTTAPAFGVQSSFPNQSKTKLDPVDNTKLCFGAPSGIFSDEMKVKTRPRPENHARLPWGQSDHSTTMEGSRFPHISATQSSQSLFDTPKDYPIPAFTSFGADLKLHTSSVESEVGRALDPPAKSPKFGRPPPHGYIFGSPAEEKLYHAIMTLIEEADEETGLKAVEFYFNTKPWSDKVLTLYEIFRAALKRHYSKICGWLTKAAQDQSFTLHLLELACRGPMDTEIFKLLVDSERSLGSPKSSSECARHYRQCLKLVSSSKADMPEITDLILKRIKETHDTVEEIRAKRSVAEALISSLDAGNVESANQMLDTFDLADIKKHFDKSATAEFRKRLDGLDLPERLARLRTK